MILIKVVICFVALLMIYFVYGPPAEVEADMINMALYGMIVPLFLIPATIVGCLSIGLPIHISIWVKEWWHKNAYIGLVGLITGLVLVFLSPYYPDNVKIIENDTDMISSVPNQYMLNIGWFMTAFFLLHVSPHHVINCVFNNTRGNKGDSYW